MPDGDQSSSENPLDNDARLLLATFAGLVLATGSALIWRAQSVSRGQSTQTTSDSERVSLFTTALSGFQLLDTFPAEKRAMEDPLPSSGNQGDLNRVSGVESKDAKSARSKERRRRGKDPLKEIFKGGKKSKSLLKAIKSTTGNGDGDVTTIPQILESHDGSVGTSSRSSSLASLKSRDKGKEVGAPERLMRELSEPLEDDADTTYSTVPTTHMINVSASEPGFHIMHDDAQPKVPSPLVVSQSEFSHLHDSSRTAYLDRLDRPHMSLSSSSTSYSGSPSDSQYQSTPESSVSDKPHDHSLLVPSQSMPPYVTDRSSTNTPSSASSVDGRKTNKSQKLHLRGSWDGQSPLPSSNDPTTFRKPPRFRSKSKTATSGSVSPIPASVSYTPPPYHPSDSPPLASPSSSPHLLPSSLNPEPSLPSLTFPTLNPPSPSPSSSSGPSTNGRMGVNGSHHSRHTPPTSRAATHQTPTPSHTPDPQGSLSTQTQIASLRGALEAARMREEKCRQDAEKYSKECELLKWKWGEDVIAWRRREAELHTQIQQMVHQIQAYAAVFVSMSPSPHIQLPNQNQAWQSYPSHHMSPSPSPQIPQQQPRAASSTVSSPQILSPTSPSLPFAMYPTPAPHQNFFSLLFPGSGSSSRGPGSSATSVSESSSVGSMSPVLNNSPSFRRGRRRNRTRTMTAANGNSNGARTAADDWIVTGEEGSANGGEHDSGVKEEGEPEFSNILADAILKRPDSIRVRTPTSGSKSQQQRDSVLKFASISDNVESATEDEVMKSRAGGNEIRGATSGRDFADGTVTADAVLQCSGTAGMHKTPKPSAETAQSSTE